MNGATTEPGPCQVRSKTEHPCPHPAVVKMRGIPLCEQCAREQEAYFAIGKLVAQAQGPTFHRDLVGLVAEAGRR